MIVQAQGGASNARQAEIQQAIQDAQRAVQAAAADARAAARQARTAAQGARNADQGGAPARAGDRPGTIVINQDDGDPVRISVDREGIHVYQNDNSTTIPLRDVVPRGAVQISYAISAALIAVAIVGPLMRFFLRRVDRRMDSAAISAAVQARLDAMDRNIDTVAVELERVSEGQRFTAKLLEQRPMEHAQRSDR